MIDDVVLNSKSMKQQQVINKPSQKKIGLVLAYKGTNYGALLQAYATQYMVESLGFETEIIDYYSTSKLENICFSLSFFKHYLKARKDRAKIRSVIKNQEQNEIFIQNREVRRQISNEFRKRKLHNIREIRGLSNLKCAVKEFAAIIIGSDQKWIPGACFSRIDSLRFVPDGVRRISYATSLGVSEYPKLYWADSKKMWKRIDYLSVREEQGADIIKQICGDINVEVVLDPTYLLTKEQWETIVPRKQMTDKKYGLCYFLGNDVESKMYAKRYAELRGLHIISLFSNESFSDIDLTYADEVISGVTPEEFINWIRGAEVILTDSFHGLAFSVINGKQLYIFYRKRDNALQSRNSRIDNILKTWNIENRLILNKGIDWGKYQESFIDYEGLNKRLAAKRKDSLNFLKNALSL